MKSPLINSFLVSICILLISPSHSIENNEIKKIIEKMTPEEKIGQMIMVYNSPIEFINQYHIGNVLIMSNMLKNPDKLRSKLSNIQTKSKIKLFVAIDQEGGSVNRLGRIKKWKNVHSAKVLSTKSTDEIVTYINLIALALNDLGINMNLAPVLDPSHNWKNEIAFMEENGRSFGKTFAEMEQPATAFIKGFSQNNILCISKHFPGYDVKTNSDHQIAISEADSASVAYNTKIFYHTTPLVGGIMMSSIHYVNFCKRPSVFSKKMVSLARAADDDKMIITDDLWGAALRGYVSKSEKVHPVKYSDKNFKKLIELAFLAGNDILMITFPKKVALMQEVLLKLANSDPKYIEQINRSVFRILKAKTLLGLL